jgi:hypothetical protein
MFGRGFGTLRFAATCLFHEFAILQPFSHLLDAVKMK